MSSSSCTSGNVEAMQTYSREIYENNRMVKYQVSIKFQANDAYGESETLQVNLLTKAWPSL